MAFTRNYRTEDSSYTKVTQPETPVGGIIRLTLPEPPSFNAMIDMAKERTRKGYGGKWLKQAAPIVYANNALEYKESARLMLLAAGYRAPATPWPRWSLTRADFRFHQLRDRVELACALKWPVDLLVTLNWVEDDSVRHLIEMCIPSQVIDKEHRGVDLFIRRDG